jgi:hypothetical protein
LRERLATVLIIPSSSGSQLGGYSARINDRIIFCTYSLLLTTHVCTALYDRIVLLICKFWTACLYLRSYLFELLNCLSEWCKWYTVGKLQKICNFFMLKLFSHFQYFKFKFENRKDSKTRLKRIFNLFSKPQIRIIHLIGRWKATEIAQLCYLYIFLNSSWILNNFENTGIRIY